MGTTGMTVTASEEMVGGSHTALSTAQGTRLDVCWTRLHKPSGGLHLWVSEQRLPRGGPKES